MKSYQVNTKIEKKYHSFLKKLAKKNDTTISDIVKKLIEEHLSNVYYEDNLNSDKNDKMKKILIEKIDTGDLEEKLITVKLGEKLHKTYKEYCVGKEISMKKSTRKIIRMAYVRYK